MNCRILYLVGGLGFGGLERQLSYLLHTMDRERYKPAVFVWNYNKEDIHLPQIRELGIPLYHFPKNLSRAAKLRAFRYLVGRLKPEVIHSYSFYTNIAAYFAARRTGAVAVGSVRNDFILDKNAAGPLLGRLSARWPAEQICNSYKAADNARHSGGFFVPRRFHVVCNGLDLTRFKKFPLFTNGRLRILAVGYLLPFKRWDRLLIAAQELKRRGFDYQVQIAGDGPLRESLERQAQELRLTDCVEFLGHQDSIPRLLAEANFVVHTSDNEGFPNAVMEAMACGRAVVATDAGDIPSLVEDGTTGFLVRRGDSAMLIERMAKLITDPDLCQRMGDAARAKAEQSFGLESLVERTIAAYRASGWRDS